MSEKILLLFVLVLALVGCSSGSNTPVMPQASGSIDITPIIDVSAFGDDGFQATGMLGAYELVIHPKTMTADLVSKRSSAIGEDYLVSGIAFFTIAPCPNCLKITGVSLDLDGNAVLTFAIAHPFEPGNTSEAPTAENRLDLDVFDLAMVILPTGTPAPTPTTYGEMGVSVYTGYCVNPDGYTQELEEVLTDTVALPYFLVVDDSADETPPVSTYNELAMGSETTFDVGFDLSSGMLRFDMYLTMGYGFGAKRPGRLQPKYYNPEFNRKAAWKVTVASPGGDAPAIGNTWDDNDNSTPYIVSVKVYDWQQGATVYTGAPEDFGDADASNVFAASEVASVTVEIPGMNPTPLPSLAIPTSGTGTPDDPLIFDVPVANVNDLNAGEYIGLVRVLDGRVPSTDWETDGRDYLIDTPDGVQLDMYKMPEYATYQTFIATVEDYELSQIKVVSQYRWVTDRISQSRGLDEVIDIFKETKTDLVFQGWLTQRPCPESCSDLPSQIQQECEINGYSYEYLRNAISEIKVELPDILFGGGMQAEYLYSDEVSGDTDEERRDNAWAMALDPSKWGIDISKRDMQCYWAKRWGVVGETEECPDEEELKEAMPQYFPDLTNPDFQEVFLNRAYGQIDAGADAMWIDMLYAQANLLKQPYFDVYIDENHPFVQDSHEAASQIVDSIHEYGQMKGKYIYVITWVMVERGGSIIQLHPEPNVDIAMISPDANEILDRASGSIGLFNEEAWAELVEIIEETIDIPIYARIDYGGIGRSPLNVFSQELTKEQQIEFLIKADTFFSDIGINFIYPIHGGDMGPQGQVTRLSYGLFNWYDALAPEFETYDTIKELALIKSER